MAGKGREPDSIESVVVRAAFVGADPNLELVGEGPLEHRCNYFLGNDPAKWRADVPNYAAVVYRDVYPGVDLQYEGKGGALICSYLAASESDLAQVKFRYEGFDCAHPEGNATVTETGRGQFRVEAPWGAVLEPLSSGQVGGLAGNSAPVAASTPEASGATLVSLVYSTFLGGGGNDGYDGPGSSYTAIAVDQEGSAYVTGYTYSADFPTVNPYQTFPSGPDAFVTKLNSAGNALVYSTYLGGTYSYDCGQGIAVDQSGSAYVAGNTWSADFPTVNPYQTDQGGSDVFVTKLNSAGNVLMYSTYLGGSSDDYGHAIAVDQAGSAHVTGETISSDFPTQNPYDGSYNGGTSTSGDAFVTKLSSAGNALVYSTYLGGSGGDWGRGIAVDQAGSAYVTGTTGSSDFPTQNPYDGTFKGVQDAYVSKLAPAGNALVYSTYLGGSDLERGISIATGNFGCVYVAGRTLSPDFPMRNAYDASYNGGTEGDVFVTELAASGSLLVYSTYLGGSSGEYNSGIAADSARFVYVTGATASTDFPTQNPYNGNNSGGWDVFVTKLSRAPSSHSVETLADSGPGSLREAMAIATNSPGPDTIRFAVTGTIQPTTPLPYLSDATGGTVIDGLSAPGATPGHPTVILDGSLAGSGSGVEVTSSGNLVRGLAIRKFPGAGVAVSNPAAERNTISQNLIYDNGALGIGVSGGAVPISIDTVLLAGSDSAYYVAGVASEKATIELFLAERYLGKDTVQDPTGHGEAWLYLGSDTADDVTGHWSIPAVNSRAWSYVTATATDTLGNTSEFALNRRLVPDSLIYTAYCPVHMIVTSPDGQDSIGPEFNTFGSTASYDDTHDWGVGPNGVPDEPDKQVTITNIRPGLYRIEILPDEGAIGYYFFGIRVDGTEANHWAKIDGFGDTTHTELRSTAYPNPVPSPGEMAVVGFTPTAQRRGDMVADGIYNVQDVVALVNFVFRGAAPPHPSLLADVNCDGFAANVQDVVRLVEHVFRGGAVPCP